MKPVKSTKATGILMYYRDQLNRDANELMGEAEKALERAQVQADSLMHAAKTAYHAAKIQSNRMKKQAQMVQEAINEELELEVRKEQIAAEAWEVKSQAHLKAELECSEELEDLLKKTN